MTRDDVVESTGPATTPAILASIIMPALNEEAYISDAITSLLEDSDETLIEILVVDGGSTDRTVEIVAGIARAERRVKLVQNPRRIQSAGFNIGATLSDPRANVLIRADCHAIYPRAFIKKCLDPLSDSKISSVVVPMRTVGRTCIQRAISAAQNSVLGNGGSSHRKLGRSRFVDHGHHAAVRKGSFLQLGGYDERFTHNEDAEFDVRLVANGGMIWLNTDAAINYYPRSSISSLSRQYFKHGSGRALNFIKHRSTPKLRQLIPVLVLIINAISILALPFTFGLSFIIFATYLIINVLLGIVIGVSRRDACAAASGLAAVVMHNAWAIGFCGGCLTGRRKLAQPGVHRGEMSSLP